MNCSNKELLHLLKGMSFLSTQHIADNNGDKRNKLPASEKLQVTFFQKISENIRPLKNNRSKNIPPTKHPTEMLVNTTSSILVNEDVETTSSSISLPNPEEIGEKICSLELQIKAQSKAGSRDASSSISLPNLKENREKIRFLEQHIKAQSEAESRDASSSISLPNLKENKEKIRFLEQ